MTYNPDEWEVGDLAWITTNPDNERIRNSPWAQGRMLRMVVRRHADGSNTGDNSHTYRWLEGDLHWVSTNGSWIKVHPRDNDVFLTVERAVAVEPEVLAQQNDRPATPAYPRQASTWAPSGGDTMHATLYSTAGLEAPVPVSRIRAVQMTMPDGTTRNLPVMDDSVIWRVDD
jgi:hypothetical protein